MMINSTSAMQYQAIQQPQSQQRPVSDHAPMSFISQATFSNQAQQLYQQEQEIAKQYDVTQMTRPQMQDMAKQLRSAGLINDREQMLMTFELPKSLDPSQKASPNERHDFLSEFNARYEFAKHDGSDALTTQVLGRITDTLAQLDQLRTS